MNTSQKRDFDREAATWDENAGRVKLAADVAEVMIRELCPAPDMDALDYGCGTGLVTLELQPLVRSITGADTSQGMLDVLREKARRAGVQNLRTQLVDLTRGGVVEGRYHRVFSTMTLHHVADPAALFAMFRDLLLPSGQLGIADLDEEDGSFHGDNTGVHHLGFAREHLEAQLQAAGFEEVHSLTAASVCKPTAGGGTKTFTVFLLVARRP